MTLQARVAWYQWADEDGNEWLRELGAEGTVFYVIEDTSRRNDSDGGWAVVTHLHQPFARDGPKHYKGATEEEVRKNVANIWKWDGNREAPTLDPSFLCVYPSEPGFRIHSYLRGGKLELLGDSTVNAHAPMPRR